MRSTATQYVGIDVHQATLVCAVKDETGQTIIESKLATRADAITGFLRGLPGRIRVAFEEGTQAQWLFDLIRPIAEEVIVCDPRRIATKGNKGDEIDAERLSELLGLNALTPVFHRGGATRDLKEIVRCYEALVDDTTRAMLRIRALYRARAIATPARSVYHPNKRSQWLEQITDRGGRYRAERFYEQLDTLTALRKRTKVAMMTEARRHKAYGLLRSVPLIGPVRAAELVAIIATPRRFRTKRQLWAYAGLAVVTRSSGEWSSDASGQIRRSRRLPLTRGLNRNFNRVLKKVFKGAARDATARAGELRAWYLAAVGRGMREEMARLTVARKIAAMVLAIWTKGVPYDGQEVNSQPV